MAKYNGTRAARFFAPRNGPALPKSKPVSPKMRADVYKRDGGRCRECDRPLKLFGPYAGHPAVAEIDHIIPRSRGGRTQPGNLRALCCRCNRTKSNA